MTTTPATSTKTTKATKAPAKVTSLAAKRATKASAAKAAPKGTQTVEQIVAEAKAAKAAPAKRTAAKRGPSKAEIVAGVELLADELRAQGAQVTTSTTASTSSVTEAQAQQLVEAHERMTREAQAFETLVCELIAAGASPAHVSRITGVSNSSVRRIVKRGAR